MKIIHLSKRERTRGKRKRSTRKRRIGGRNRTSSNGGGIGVLLVLLLVYFFAFRESDLPETFEEQIAALNEAETQMKHLITFVGRQRDDLIQREKAIAELESERESLEPIVEADRETVIAILDAQEGHRVWQNRIEGIILALAAMLVGRGCSWLWSKRRRPISERENGK